jgi:hypothetical protein
LETLYIGAIEGTRWPLDLNTVEQKLRERYPDLVSQRRNTAPPQQDYLSFDLSLGGEMRHGIYIDGGHLALSDGTPADWAEIVAWFLSLLPNGTPTAAYNEHTQQATPVPERANASQVKELLESVIADD